MSAELIHATTKPAWSGSWVATRLGLSLGTTCSAFGTDLTDLMGLAVRRNPRRAHLLVSTVLGKHIPTDPRLVYGSGALLGLLVADALHGADPHSSLDRNLRLGVNLRGALAGDSDASTALLTDLASLEGSTAAPFGTVVLGFAETATALGHAVADVLCAPYLHSTRRRVPGVMAVGTFEEEHSHATSHLLLPADAMFFTSGGPLILVDDELSTGRTALNTILALQAVAPRARYVIAALVDLRSHEDRERMVTVAADLGVDIDVVALAAGTIELPADVLAAGQSLVAAREIADGINGNDVANRETATELASALPGQPPGAMTWPTGLREGARHGFAPADRHILASAMAAASSDLAGRITGDDVLVLGHEELMYAPLCLALGLVDHVSSGVRVRFSTTTRSPILAVDEPGYAVRTRLTFPAHDDPTDGPGQRFAYNVAAGDDPSRRFSDIVLVIDAPADTSALRQPDGLLRVLGAVCDRVHVVVVPALVHRGLPPPLHGPTFGSYHASEVSWLLTDLSDADLEAPTEEREEAIQSGGAHYAESLPVEYQPSSDYQRLFSTALSQSAARVAHAVGVVTEMVLDARGDGAVLVSLARAGTPVGVLMRRWAQFAHGVDLPHYAISIVRGKGIDSLALRYLAANHDPAAVVFVDGWTGKGAITRELFVAVNAANAALGLGAGKGFDPALAVLADTGHCVSTYGTRDDFLIPSACLNSTVSGLVSRTVLNKDLLGPGDFHGAKFYEHLAAADVSVAFLDAVNAQFASVAEDVVRDWPVLKAQDRTPTWAGQAAVEQISREYGIGDVNLVKPGVGETTRVLLRRVPWKILVRTDAAAELAHVRLLAEQRGVEVEEVSDLPYSCVGLIHPKFTRGATGVLGTGVSSTGVPGTGVPSNGVRSSGVRSTGVPSSAPSQAGVLRGAVIVACDLDRTLIYSRAAMALDGRSDLGGRNDQGSDNGVVCVEHLNGEPLSFMTSAAAASLLELSQISVFVPTTTRTREQLRRVKLPGPASGYAIAANGGFLLVDGRECLDWTAQVTTVLAATSVPLEVVWEHLRSVCLPAFTRKVREADGLFCYAVVERDLLPPGFVAELNAWAVERGWTSSLQGGKLYVVPQELTKGAAVSEVASRVGASLILAAGDSLLDAEMLEGANRGIRPGHGELFDTGWAADHVAVTPGVGALAGEQIARWLLESAAAANADRRDG